MEESKDEWKSSWWWLGDNWPDKSTCLIRKASWQSLKKDIERRIELVKENQLIVNKFLTQLSKVEDEITQLEARLVLFRDKEESSKVSGYFLIAIVIILLVFFLYLIATGKILSKQTGIKSE